MAPPPLGPISARGWGITGSCQRRAMFDGEEYPEERPRSAASSDIRRPTRAIQMEEQEDQLLKMMVQVCMTQVREQFAAASQGQVVTERAEARQPSNRKVRAEAWRLLRVRSGAKRASVADGREYGGGREDKQSRRGRGSEK